MSNLVLGAVGRGERAGWVPRIAPFLISLRRTGYDGECVLFHPCEDRWTGWAVESLGARARPYRQVFPHLTLDSNVVEEVQALLPPMDFANFSIKYHRYALYLIHLLAERARYAGSSIVLCDTLDVVFQSDPFHSLEDRLYCFLEDPAPGAEDPLYTEWVHRCFDERTLSSLRLREVLEGKPVLNSGVILGSYDKIVEYLRRMVQCFGRLEGRFQHGDQFLHNYVCYSLSPPGLTIVKNGTRVANLNRVQPGTICRTSEGWVCYRGGEPASIVHMYNRVPELYAEILKRYSLASGFRGRVPAARKLDLILLWLYELAAEVSVWLHKKLLGFRKRTRGLGSWLQKGRS